MQLLKPHGHLRYREESNHHHTSPGLGLTWDTYRKTSTQGTTVKARKGEDYLDRFLSGRLGGQDRLRMTTECYSSLKC